MSEPPSHDAHYVLVRIMRYYDERLKRGSLVDKKERQSLRDRTR